MLPGTLPNAIKKLKLMSYTAFKNGWITFDPFAGFRVVAKYRDRRFFVGIGIAGGHGRASSQL